MTPSASDAPATLLREVRSRVPVDAAALLAQATPEDIEAVLRALPPDFAARIAAHLPGAADDMPEIDSDARIEALMAPAVGMLPPNTTVAGAVDWLSRCPEVADVTYLYVVAEDRRLLGMVVMRDLLLARPGQQLSDVMLHDPFHFTPQMDIGDAIRAAVSRHYPVYPVCDDSGRLVGLVRGWQLFERQFHLVELVVAGFVDTRRLTCWPDKRSSEEVAQGRVVLPVSDDRGQQIRATKERTVVW